MTVRLPLVVGFARAMEMIITGRRVGADEAERIGLANEVVPEGKALERAQELAKEIAELPQGAIRSDKESVLCGVGRTLEERLRIEAEMTMSMFMRRDSHTIGAAAFKAGNLSPQWPHHGCEVAGSLAALGGLLARRLARRLSRRLLGGCLLARRLLARR